MFEQLMMSEIIAMTISDFNGNPYKQYSKSIELILPKSAHAAFHKACEMYEIKPIMIPVNPIILHADINASIDGIGIVGSAPGLLYNFIKMFLYIRYIYRLCT